MVWPAPPGAVTAVLVGDYENLAACASTEQAAVGQIKELLDWRCEHEPWNVDPDFSDPVLFEVKVEVRPQYTKGKRVVPCPDTVWLRVPCVRGVQENGMKICAVPPLGLRFNFQDVAELKGLVTHYVREALQSLRPRDLARRLPPQSCHLEELTVRVTADRERKRPPHERPELRVLFTVADSLLHDFGRKRGASAAYGREALSATLMQKLAAEKTNFLLVGPSGVGKSTLLLDAVRRLAREKIPAPKEGDDEEAAKDLRTYRFWRTNAGRLIAGMRYLGEWEERCEEVIKRLGAIDGILCAENLLELAQAGGEDASDSVGAFLLPYLQRGELRIVAEATPEEVEACRRVLPGLLDVFQVVHVPVFNDQESIHVLTRVAEAYASASKLELEPGAVLLAHRLFRGFMPYHAFPGPAARFLRALCDRRGPRQASHEIAAADVVAQFTRQTGLPEIFLRDDLPLRFEEVRDEFERQIIGQDAATTAAGRLITKIKSGLTDPSRPYGVMLFCGPTGVGKTALARLLSEFCFGAAKAKDRLVRLDMSEYAGGNAPHRFLHATACKPAKWIEQVRQQPFCVLLLDEIEKAAPEVFDVILGMLDEGRLTDRFGRVTWFRSAIIVMTSNLGSTAPTALGFAGQGPPVYESEVAKFFRPEFFNRLDEIITFNPLTRADVERIARKELSDLANREGFKSAGLRLEWSDELIGLLAREGHDYRFGARPLQRAIERIVVTPLARWRLKQRSLRDATLRLAIDSSGKLAVVT